MKDREIKRWLLEDFVKENDIKAVELEIAYKRFRTLVPSAGGGQSTQAAGIDFSTWISVSSSLINVLWFPLVFFIRGMFVSDQC